MDKNRKTELYEFYKSCLLEDCIPFWLNHSLDHEYGGYFTCLDREGKVFSTDKSVWFQGRGLWIYSRLCNALGKRDEWLEAARLGYEFLVNYCFDTDGRMFFQVTRDGKPLRKRRYLFSETFAIIALAEYYKATGNMAALDKAKSIYKMILSIYDNPANDPYKITPKVYSETRAMKAMAVPMILLNTNYILREIDNVNCKCSGNACDCSVNYADIAKMLTKEIIEDFLKPEEKALFETVGINGERLDTPAGRCINPGHSIEASWFLMKEAEYQKDTGLMQKALNILDWSLDLGWDKEYGGISYYADIEGKPIEQLEWDMKLWWPHTEALYALLLAYKNTDKQKYLDWYDKVHNYTFDRFPDKEYGEWYGYLHRDGTVSHTLKGSMWKGPFHIPRALLFCMQLLED
jgi:N-acylglucosamine 2-epimerase